MKLAKYQVKLCQGQKERDSGAKGGGILSYGPQLAFYKWAARQVSRDESCEPGEGGRIKLMPDKFCARTDKLPEPTPAHALVGRSASAARPG